MAPGNRDDYEPTIRDVARAAGVSVGTVSRVLNANGTVRAPMRDAVLRAVEELGYQPNAAARLLRVRRTKVLGMLSTDLSHPMEVAAFRGAEAAAQEHGYTLLLADTQGNQELEMQGIESFIEQRVEGVLCSPMRSVRSIREPLERAHIPLVLYGQWSRKPGVPTAVVDELNACREAVADLLRCGHRHIATFGLTREPSRHRRQVLEQLFEEAAPDQVRVEHVHANTRDLMEAGLIGALEARPRPTALILLSHGVVAGALRIINGCGLWYPEDLSVVAFGDSDWAIALRPHLSVIAVDYEVHTAEAARLLVRIVEGEHGITQGPVGVSRYTRRGSVGPPPVNG
jgi:LacI family transcriptional regulator